MSKYKVIDLFSGCGGLSNGFEQAGFVISAGLDTDQAALDTFSRNHLNAKTFCTDIAELDVKSFIKESSLGDIDIVIGGPPCQGFSISGKRDINDKRNGLYKPFFNFVNELRPKVFVLENVPNLVSMANGAYKYQILDLFKSIGYNVSLQVLIASNYGVPQIRKRVFFIGTRKRQNIFEFPLSTHGIGLIPFVTTKDAISDLPEDSIQDGKEYNIDPLSDYQRMIRKNCKSVYNHQITFHSDITKKIISLVPDGGNYKDLPKKYISTRKVNIAWTRYSSSKPSFTIDTGHRHHFHYQFNRVPTVRESARLQSFSDKFIFSGSKTSQYRQVGNAVPPLLGYRIAKSIKEQLL
jgi:DNA (cytosine-5)-methyltransferase 1